jgi:hypothetical protein
MRFIPLACLETIGAKSGDAKKRKLHREMQARPLRRAPTELPGRERRRDTLFAKNPRRVYLSSMILKRRLTGWTLWTGAVLLVSGAARSAEPLPAAPLLMQAMLAQLPRQTVFLKGRLLGAQDQSAAAAAQDIEILFDFTNAQATARYTLLDAFQKSQAQFAITRRSGRPDVYAYFAGDPPVAVPAPDLYTPLAGSEITWMDLTLGFLWWTNGVTIGRQEIKDQMCYVVDLLAPPSAAEARYSSVRLWIETSHAMMMQAEAYDRAGNPARRVAIKSFKKVDEQWMIKDLEIRRLPSGRRTLLRIDEVRVGADAAPAPPQADRENQAGAPTAP